MGILTSVLPALESNVTDMYPLFTSLPPTCFQVSTGITRR